MSRRPAPILLVDRTITAAPFTARQCPECKRWVYVDRPPYGEDGDPTKTLRDFLHWREKHMPKEERGESVMFPFFDYNDQPVEAVLEAVPDDFH